MFTPTSTWGEQLAATDAEAKRANELLFLIEQDETAADWVRTEDASAFDEVLRRWVEVALTQLVLLLGVGEGEIEFAQAVRGEDGSGRIIAFTRELVAVTEVADPMATKVQVDTVVIPRSRITSLSIAGGSRILFDPTRTDNRTAVIAWPGSFGLSVEYAGLTTPVAISGSSLHPWERARPGAIMTLLESLREDLAGAQPDSMSGS